ncbi:aminotransferase class III-fold pyridoxal phosphate-dependent enzyme, partial [Acinetobacter nosocomialis]
LNTINEKLGLFKQIRGEGLLLGCVLKDEYAGKAKNIVTLAGEEGLLALVAGMDVVRFAPSLIIPFEDIDEGLNRFARALARL